MAVPTWDQLLRPTLELASEQDVTRNVLTEHLLKTLPPSEEDKKERIKSGPLKLGNRAGWAMSHLTKARLIEKVSKATYRATDAGKQLLADHEGKKIDYHTLKAIDGFQEAWDAASKRNQEKKASDPVGDDTPEEAIDLAVSQIEDELRSELLSQLSTVDPYRFEQVVIDVLFAMGYGGSRAEAAQVTQKSNDEGIDGVINEDRLGLDVIYVQAKRWKNPVGRKEIQSFVGALAGKQANKGVFITTSSFVQNAFDYAKSVSQKVVLIDGDRLGELMIEHGVGVSMTRTIAIKRIDSDYFEDA